MSLLGFIAVAQEAQAVERRGVFLTWEKIPQAIQYEFELSKDPEFQTVIERQSVPTTSLRLNLDVGDYYYRVRVIDRVEALGRWSKPARVIVVPVPPRPLSPADGALFKVKSNFHNDQIPLRWENKLKGTEILVEITFDGASATYRSKALGLLWKPKRAGSYSWRIGYKSPNGLEWSKPRSFKVELKALEVEPLPTPTPTASPSPEPSPSPSPSLEKEKSRKVVSFNIGLGPTWVSFRDSVNRSFSEVVITAKGGLLFPFARRWALGISGFVTVVPLSTPASVTAARFLGANLRVGYDLITSEFWKFSLFGGFYYTTMMVGQEYGFTHQSGPQLYPTLRRSFRSGDSLQIYCKYSPVANGIALLKLENREIAFGSSWTWLAFKRKKAISLGLDVSQIHVGDSALSVDVTTVTLSGSIHF